jgi:nicotinamide-nucleotide amidase
LTGLAGPGGDGSSEFEVGTVFVALAADGYSVSKRLFLPYDRERVRISAASHALDMVRRYLTSVPAARISSVSL